MNVQISDNPLHKFLLIPKINKPEPTFTYIKLAVKYVEKMFRAFYGVNANLDRHEINSFEVLWERFDNLAIELADEEE